MDKTLLLISTLTLLFAVDSFGQKLNGKWQGAINIQGTQLNIITSFDQSDKGGDIYGTIDIPQQGAFDIKLEDISISESDSVFFHFETGQGLAEFKGLVENFNRIEGQFFQRGMDFPFYLKKEIKE